MKKDTKFNEIKGNILLKNNKVENFKVQIFPEFAILKINDPRSMRDLVKLEKKAGNNNIIYNEQQKFIIERFPGKNRKEVTQIIVKQLNKHKINITKNDRN